MAVIMMIKTDKYLIWGTRLNEGEMPSIVRACMIADGINLGSASISGDLGEYTDGFYDLNIAGDFDPDGEFSSLSMRRMRDAGIKIKRYEY
jgi:hypothetical protein